jgi:NitT/TauT family transport system permease protein
MIRRRAAAYVVSATPFAVLIALWLVLTSGGVVSEVFLPSPGATASAILHLVDNSFFREHVLPSVFRVGVAFLISAAIAFPLGIIAGRSITASGLVHPLCAFMRYIPVASLVPLCILWFGIDDRQKIAVIAIGVVFQLILLFSATTALVPNELVEAGKTFGLSNAQVLRRIIIPAAMPSLWDDLRISAGWAWSYLVLAELVAGNRGVGYFVVQSQRYLETANVFAGILFIGALGGLIDALFRVSAKRLFRWV